MDSEMEDSYESEEHLDEEEENDPDSLMMTEENTGIYNLELPYDQLGLWPMNDDVEEGDDSNGEAEEKSGEKYVFSFTGIFCRRLYRSQQRPKETNRAFVNGNSVNEILESIWVQAKNLMDRQVTFENDVPSWVEKTEPTIEDMHEFVTLQVDVKRKLYAVSVLTPRLLTNWRDKCVKIFVYAYSSRVETAGQYQQVTKKLLAPQNPDRAGAHSTRDDAALVDELRRSHCHLEGHQSSWLLWANTINSSPAHKQEDLKKAESPPFELSKYFRWAAVSEAARLQSLHRGMVVARTSNSAWCRELDDVKTEVSLGISILQGVMQKLEAMNFWGHTESELFSAMESATQPEESSLSHPLAEKVIDCTDIDHA
ncbi:uncharacterized protein LOC135707530 [Ochlerotatus camptorhynchus]|uniref:uncharacterized protein LOC135707530 n=1 Tax=Ochlerotatus camptorhynchus TaxID=644619 RepID=UPI0031E0A988